MKNQKVIKITRTKGKWVRIKKINKKNFKENGYYRSIPKRPLHGKLINRLDSRFSQQVNIFNHL